MNKGIIIVTIAMLSLTGCANVANIFADRFDNVEYGKLVELNVDAIASEGNCPLSKETYKKALWLKIYSEGTMNDTSSDLYEELYGLVEEFYNRENPSDVYCNLKWENIVKATDDAIALTGSRIKK